jgi:hypothetical protein
MQELYGSCADCVQCAKSSHFVGRQHRQKGAENGRRNIKNVKRGWVTRSGSLCVFCPFRRVTAFRFCCTIVPRVLFWCSESLFPLLSI